MFVAVIPACNEAKAIDTVLQSLLSCDLQKIILVANGCTDLTEEISQHSMSKDRLEILSFHEPLGLDIPRAVGAAYAQKYHPQGIVFLDGDMTGKITSTIRHLLKGIKKGLDLALTNCYPTYTQRSDLAATVLKYRQEVNKRLGLFSKIGHATPSHGPHALSAKLLSEIPLKALAVPPLVLAYAAQHGFRVGVSANISHELLGSKLRSDEHAQNIANTIIGDCLQALSYLDNSTSILSSADSCNSAYRKARRFDLLEHYLVHNT